MGLRDYIRGVGRLLNTSQDATTKGSANEEIEGLENFEDLGYQKINHTIKNARWAYEHDSAVNSSLNNAIITANSGFTIVADSPEHEAAAQYIRSRLKDWDLKNAIEETATRAAVDGSCFLQKRIENGKTFIHFLAYDGDDFDIKIIRNPDTEEVLGYKQKALITRLEDNWEKTDFDELDPDPEEEEFNFAPWEIICAQYRERDGEGQSAIYPALDLVDSKIRVEKYMLKAAHKAGSILGIEVGADGYDMSNLNQTDIDTVVDFFSEHDGKEVVAYNAGIKPQHIGAGVLLDYTLYLKYYKAEIRSILLTPDSKFESSKGSRFTAKEQMSGSAGFVIYVEYLREFIKSIFEPQLIDFELALIREYRNSIGHVKIQYDELREDEEATKADVATKLTSIDGTVDLELVRKAYFPSYVKAEKQALKDVVKEEEPQEVELVPLDDGTVLLNTKEPDKEDEDPTVRELRRRGWKGLRGRGS